MDLLISLDEKKSCGPDGISSKILKISTPALVTPLTKLFNYCIINTIWPTEWKRSNVIPAFKKDEPTSKTNYRSINLLSVIPKVFEKIMFDQLYPAFSPIFSENMSGFLRGHSCCTALLKLTEDWRSALDDKKDVAVVAIDLSKAFDSLCHNLLLAKLNSYGLDKSALDLIRSYLIGRKQRVKCNNTFSDWLPVYCGVPQGSLLGPLLFNIYVNDINSLETSSSLRLYADDTSIYDSDQCPASLEFSINTDVSTLDLWFRDNFFMMNAGKTQAMVMGKSGYDYELKVGDSSIQIANEVKILGVTLDKCLTYEPHIKVMLRKVYAKVAALRGIRRMIPIEVATKLYKAYILPHLEYCCPLLIGIGKGLNKKLESANHYTLKTLFNMGSTSDYDTVLKMASVQSLEQRRFEQSLIMFFKCSRLHGPQYISNFFKVRTSRYNLRNTGLNVEQASYNTLYLHNSYSYIISHIWNELPNDIKNSDLLSEFRILISKIDFTDKLNLGCRCARCT